MNLQVVHLDKQRDKVFDEAVQSKFDDHIITHFHLKEEKLKAILDVHKKHRQVSLTLHFHYGNKHSHFHAKHENSYNAFKHIVKELEREMSRPAKRKKTNRSLDFYEIEECSQ